MPSVGGSIGAERCRAVLFCGRPPLLLAFLLLVAMPGAPSSFLLPLVRHLLLVAMPLFLVARTLLVAFLLLVVRPGAPSSDALVPSSKDATSSVLAPSSKARSP